MIYDAAWFAAQENLIPKDAVRTRFAPSPTGYMHVGGLRTALYAYLIAKKSGGSFLLRIEDTDTARLVEDATKIIIDTLRGAGLDYDEGPDIGGPAGPYTQSERKPLYKPYAELLCEKDAAYYCFCQHVSHDDREHTESGDTEAEPDPCRDLPYAESKHRADSGENYVIRMKMPRTGSTTVHDMIFGDITVENKTLDDMVLLKSDGLPTYNFANVVDDHLMGITHVLRGSEYISSAPKYNLLYEAFGWEVPLYVTVSPVMRDKQHKLSKRHGDPTYDDLLRDGYLPEAILNYVALLGWSPGGEQEFFTLQELEKTFEISGISRSPAIFDTEKLTYFNAAYLRAMSPQDFERLSRPYIRKEVTNECYSSAAIAAILQPRCEKLTEIPGKLAFFDSLPDYDTALYVHKKSKTNEKISLDMLAAVKPALECLPDWSEDALRSAFTALAESLGVKNATLMWPVRIAVSGMAVTPGGAVELCAILGRAESLRRIGLGIQMLSDYGG